MRMRNATKPFPLKRNFILGYERFGACWEFVLPPPENVGFAQFLLEMYFFRFRKGALVPFASILASLATPLLTKDRMNRPKC